MFAEEIPSQFGDGIEVDAFWREGCTDKAIQIVQHSLGYFCLCRKHLQSRSSMFSEKFITAHLAEKFQNDLFLEILPQNLQFLSVKNFDDFFLVITFFTIFCPSVFSYFTHDESYSYFCALYTPTPYIHTHMLFSRFYTLLCALVTVYTAFTIYFFLIHHCTSSLSSLHIFVHNCTFCASLHTKWSPLTSLSTWEHKQ